MGLVLSMILLVGYVSYGHVKKMLGTNLGVFDLSLQVGQEGLICQ